MRSPKLLANFFCFAAAPLIGFGWSAEGHRAIGEIAANRLNAQPAAAIKQILGTDDLAGIATWADDIRAAARHTGPLATNPEARAFNSAFPKNGSWHFVNLPLGLASYTDDSPFSSPDDVVHAVNRAVAVLEGKPSEMTPVQALRIIVHCVGDLHQPLHVGTGYYDLKDPAHPKLLTDPAQAQNHTNDRGGNELYLTKSEELHALWDNALVKRIAGADPHAVAQAASKRIRAMDWRSPGDYHAWAESWATDTLHVAARAYDGITFGPAALNPKGELSRDEITLPPDYAKLHTPDAADQIAKAGFHLAELLNHIAWKVSPGM